MKILLIGHSIVDHINGVISPGGIFYSLAGMLGAENMNDQLFFKTGLNDKFKKLFHNYSEANLFLKII